MSSLMNWNTTAANNNEAAPDGAPENMAPSGVNDTMREIMARVKEMQAALPWIDYGKGSGTVTYTQTTTNIFEVEGSDVTSAYTKGRRVKVVGTSTGTIYGTIETSTFTVNTKVTVNWDNSGSNLQSETLSVQLGLQLTGNPYPNVVHNAYGYRNYVMNGAFNIWQRRFTLTESVVTGGNKVFAADRWGMTAVSNTFSMGQSTLAFDIANSVFPFHETTRYAAAIDTHAPSASTEYLFMSQFIEGVKTLSGKDVCVSFYAKHSSSADPLIGISFQQNYGANGQGSANTPLGVVTLTNTWQRHFITGTIPVVASGTGTLCSTNGLILRIWLNDGGDQKANSGSITAERRNVFITNIQVEEGTAPTAFENRSIPLELAECERFYQTSYDRIGGTPVAIGAGSTTNGSVLTVQVATGTGSIPPSIRFNGEMYKNPTVTLYDTGGGTSSRVWAHNAGTSITANAVFVSNKAFAPSVETAITANSFVSYHFTADAEPA